MKKIQGVGQTLKGAALFTIGAEITKAGIEKGRRWWDKRKRDQKIDEEAKEDDEIKSKLDD